MEFGRKAHHHLSDRPASSFIAFVVAEWLSIAIALAPDAKDGQLLEVTVDPCKKKFSLGEQPNWLLDRRKRADYCNGR
jgi:hypothetical protein